MAVSNEVHRVQIRSDSVNAAKTEIRVDGRRLEGVTRIEYSAAVGELNRVRIECFRGMNVDVFAALDVVERGMTEDEYHTLKAAAAVLGRLVGHEALAERIDRLAEGR